MKCGFRMASHWEIGVLFRKRRPPVAMTVVMSSLDSTYRISSSGSVTGFRSDVNVMGAGREGRFRSSQDSKKWLLDVAADRFFLPDGGKRRFWSSTGTVNM